MVLYWSTIVILDTGIIMLNHGTILENICNIGFFQNIFLPRAKLVSDIVGIIINKKMKTRIM